MKNTMALSMLSLMLLTLFSGCAGSPSKGVKDSFIPVDNLVFPVNSSEITDAAQIGDDLFILGSGTLYCTNLVTGESKAVCRTDCTLMYAYDDILHLFDPSKGSFLVIAPDGTEVDSFSVSEPADSSGEDIHSFGVCDDFYVVQKKQQAGKSEAVVIDRKTKETASYSFKNVRGYFCSYKDNELLFLSSDLASDKYNILSFNAGTGKYKTLMDMSDISCCYDCQYDEASKKLSMIALAADNSVSLIQTD